jgi:hypothetical protein
MEVSWEVEASSQCQHGKIREMDEGQGLGYNVN